MWDPIEFYEDLEHSILKIMLTCGTKVGLKDYMWDPSEFCDNLERYFIIVLTCGTKVSL
jgi:hypothetical protein